MPSASFFMMTTLRNINFEPIAGRIFKIHGIVYSGVWHVLRPFNIDGSGGPNNLSQPIYFRTALNRKSNPRGIGNVIAVFDNTKP